MAQDTTLETMAFAQLTDTFAHISLVPTFKLIHRLNSANASPKAHNQEWAAYEN